MIFLLLLKILKVETHTDQMTELLQGTNGEITFPLIISTLLLAPILEELAFRHPLRDFQKNFYPSIVAILLLLVLSLINQKIVGVMLILLGLIYVANRELLRRKRIRKTTSARTIYLVSMLFFVIAHFGTLEVLRQEYWPLYIIYGAHMTVSAFFLSRLRIERNTGHSMMLHFLYNLVPVLIILL